jgi:fluoride exporter
MEDVVAADARRARAVIWAAVAVAGAAGACTRFAIERWTETRFGSDFPWASWIINPTGSFLLGVVVGLSIAHGLADDTRTVVGTGFLGAYTVVGPITFDSLRLLLEGRSSAALFNSVGGFLVPTTAALAGLALTGAL